MKKIVTIGGGTGQYTLLSGLVNYADVELTSVSPVSDSGGNSGEYLKKDWRPLVDESGELLPPGDIGKCLLALSPHPLQTRLVHRIEKVEGLKGYNAINALLVAFWQVTGDWLKAIAAVSEVLDIKGRALPVSVERANVEAELVDGTVLKSEDDIYQRVNCADGVCLPALIKNMRLVPSDIQPLPEVLAAIREANLIVIGPGCLPSSIIPVLLVKGVVEAIKNSSAKKVYISNVMAHQGEFKDFKLSTLVLDTEKYLGAKFDLVVANVSQLSDEVRQRYEDKDKAKMIEIDVAEDWDGRKVISQSLLMPSDSSRFKDYARHDAAKLGSVIYSLI